MFCIPQHACQNNCINGTVLVAGILMQLYKCQNCWCLPSLLSAQGEYPAVQCYAEVMSVSQAVALTCFPSPNCQVPLESHLLDSEMPPQCHHLNYVLSLPDCT